MIVYQFELLNRTALMPSKKYVDDTGYDCYANAAVVIAPGHTELIPLGIRCKMPYGFALCLRPRSGLSSRGIMAATGTIDNKYRGEIKCSLSNLSDKPYTVSIGDRICQLVPEMILETDFVEVKSVNTETDRAERGFGSSGK